MHTSIQHFVHTQKSSGMYELMFPTGTRWSLSGNTGQRSGIPHAQVGNREKATQTTTVHTYLTPRLSGHTAAVQCTL